MGFLPNMKSFFIPTSKHFFNLQNGQNRLVFTSILQSPLKRHLAGCLMINYQINNGNKEKDERKETRKRH